MRLLGPLMELETDADLVGLARGIAFQVAEALGVLERSRVLHEMRSLDQAGRGRAAPPRASASAPTTSTCPLS